MDEPKIINVHGIPVELWSRKTLADGNAMSHNTIEPICSAILSGDEYLQYQLDLYKGATDVINVFSNYRDFSSNSAKYFNPEYSATWYLTNNDIVKIIRDENSHPDVATGHQTYYKWINNPSVTGDPQSPSDGSWNYIGYADPYYNIEEINEKFNDISGTISANYLSAKGDITGGKNILINENSDFPRITVATKDDVEFNTVSAYRLSGKYIVVPGTGHIGTCDIYNLNVKNIADYTSGQISADFSALLYSACSGKAASAWIANNKDSLLGSAYSGAAASAWLANNKDGLLGSAKSGAAASSWLANNKDGLLGSAKSGAAASAWIKDNNKDLAHISAFDYVNNSNVITGYGGSAFAGGISSISLISNGSTSSTVITGKNRNIVFYSDKPDNLRIFSVTTGHETEYIHFSAKPIIDGYYYCSTGYDGDITKTRDFNISALYESIANNHQMIHQEIVFSVDSPYTATSSFSGLLIQAATKEQDGKSLVYNSATNKYEWSGGAGEGKTYTGDYSINVDNENDKISLNSAISSDILTLWGGSYDESTSSYISPQINFLYPSTPVGSNELYMNNVGISAFKRSGLSTGTISAESTWLNLIKNNGNYVKAYDTQSITLATADNDITPLDMSNDIIYLV